VEGLFVFIYVIFTVIFYSFVLLFFWLLFIFLYLKYNVINSPLCDDKAVMPDEIFLCVQQ